MGLSLSGEFDFEGQIVQIRDHRCRAPACVRAWHAFLLLRVETDEPLLKHCRTVFWYDLLGYGQSEKREGQDVSLGVNRLLDALLRHWKADCPDIVAHDSAGRRFARSSSTGATTDLSRSSIRLPSPPGGRLSYITWTGTGRRSQNCRLTSIEPSSKPLHSGRNGGGARCRGSCCLRRTVAGCDRAVSLLPANCAKWIIASPTRSQRVFRLSRYRP